jgi:membrane protein required for colicin V production
MLDFTTLDMLIIGLILFLSLKGLIDGFIKELFSFIGLIGGVAVAARMNGTVGNFISNNILPIENEPALKLTGFIALLLAVWLIANMISSIFEKVTSKEVGFLSRILGYGVTILKYTAIFALIMASIQNVELISKKLKPHTQNSQTMPILKELGDSLLNITERQNQTAQKNPIDLNAFDMDHIENNQTDK